MYFNHNRVAGAPRSDVIPLADPAQVRMLDALTEAAGVPHQHGQAEIEIPHKLRDYTKWVLSKEYQDKVKAEVAQARGETPQERQHRPPNVEIQQKSVSDSSKETSGENPQNEQNGLHSAFWNGLIEQSSIVPSIEDPAFWPRRVFEKFEYLIANRDYTTDKAQHALAIQLTPIHDSIRRVRTAYEIAAYSSIKKCPGKRRKAPGRSWSRTT